MGLAVLLLAVSSCADGGSSTEPVLDQAPSPVADASPPSSPEPTPAPPADVLAVEYSLAWMMDAPEVLQPAPQEGIAWMHARQTAPTEIEVDVFANTPLAFGAAFRVEFNPAMLEYQGYMPRGAFQDGAGRSTEMARLIRPGVVAWGGARLPLSADQSQPPGNTAIALKPLTTFRFRALGAGQAHMKFAEHGRELRLQDNTVVPLAWYSGVATFTEVSNDVEE